MTCKRDEDGEAGESPLQEAGTVSGAAGAGSARQPSDPRDVYQGQRHSGDRTHFVGDQCPKMEEVMPNERGSRKSRSNLVESSRDSATPAPAAAMTGDGGGYALAGGNEADGRGGVVPATGLHPADGGLVREVTMPVDALRERIVKEMRPETWMEKVRNEDRYVRVLSENSAVAVAERLVREEQKATFGEHTMAVEWQGHAEAAEKERDEARKALDEAE